jgi:spermidine synthase
MPGKIMQGRNTVFAILVFTTVIPCVLPGNDDGSCVASSSAAAPFVIKEEEHEIGYHMSLVTKSTPLFSSQSSYQKIEVYESETYGKILVLDECIQLTERDASHYNEMLAHISLMANPKPRRILVIGGGDGYVVHEVLKHPTVERVDHVELDREVIDVSKRYFPWGNAWDDARVSLHIVDGAVFVRDAEPASYDVIIQDSSDPFYEDVDGEVVTLPSSVLYTKAHFENVRRSLRTDGVFLFQAETYNIPSSLEAMRSWRELATSVGFQFARYGTIAISSYPTGQIGFCLCTKEKSGNRSDLDVIQARFEMIMGETSYYHPRLQQSCFDLPLWVERYLYGEP